MPRHNVKTRIERREIEFTEEEMRRAIREWCERYFDAAFRPFGTPVSLTPSEDGKTYIAVWEYDA